MKNQPLSSDPLPKRIAILYSDARREYFPTEQLYISEAEVKDRALIISQYLTKMGIDVALFPGSAQVSENLSKYQPDFVINLVDSVYGQEYLCGTIPATLELLKIPYTGSGMIGQAINSNKYFTKNLLEQWGITIPKYQLIKDPNDDIEDTLDFPLISKLNEVHGSIEMDDSAVTEDERGLDQRINFLMKTYRQPILIEEYIAGREVSVIVFEGLNTKVYAAEKIIKPTDDSKYQIATFNAVWGDDESYQDAITYQKYELPPRVKDQLKTAFDVLKMEDYAKFDLRVDLSGRHYIIDANSNPALGPKETMCAIGTIMDMYEINFPSLLERLIRNTLSENSNSQITQSS